MGVSVSAPTVMSARMNARARATSDNVGGVNGAVIATRDSSVNYGLYGYQNSGSALTCWAYYYAVRLK